MYCNRGLEKATLFDDKYSCLLWEKRVNLGTEARMIQIVLFKIVKYWKYVGASNHKNCSQIVYVDIVISSMFKLQNSTAIFVAP